MKSYLLLLIPLLSLFSCHTTYYYARIGTTDPYTEKDNKGNFVINSDSIQITYTFFGENAPVKLNVFNKTSRPIYIDWGNSWFIFGDGDENKVNLGQYVGGWEIQMEVAPYNQRGKELFELSGLSFDNIDDKLYKLKNLTKSDGKTIRLQTIEFNEQDTPLYMRSVLCFYIGKVDENPLLFEQDFYITTLSKANNLEPNSLAAFSNQYGDMFYTKKEHGKGVKKVFSIFL